MRMCDQAGCERQHAARGLCAGHYGTARARGMPVVQKQQRGNSALCSEFNCQNDSYVRGLCHKHHERVVRNGHTSLRPKSTCKVRGCARRHSGKGYCYSHRRRLLKYGHPLGLPKNLTEAAYKHLTGVELARHLGVTRQRAHQIKNPDDDKARAELARALAKGDVTRPRICTLCRVPQRVQGHHLDYKYPLIVVWVCVQCHAKLHPHYPGAKVAA